MREEASVLKQDFMRPNPFPCTRKGRYEARHAGRMNKKNKNDNSEIIKLLSLLCCTIEHARVAVKIMCTDYRVYTFETQESIVLSRYNLFLKNSVTCREKKPSVPAYINLLLSVTQSLVQLQVC